MKTKTPVPEFMKLANSFGMAASIWQSLLERRLAAHDLTPAQLSVLVFLARKGPARVTAIAQAMQIGQPAVTKMLAKFDGMGLTEATQDPADKRARGAALTKAGQAKLMAVQSATLPELRPFLEQWDTAEIAAFAAQLRRFAGFLDETRRLDRDG